VICHMGQNGVLGVLHRHSQNNQTQIS
jgi:hypothetical protein